MELDRHIRRGHFIVFGLLFFLCIVEGSISTWLTARFHQHHNQKSNNVLNTTHFILFTSWWSLLFSGLFFAFFQHSATAGSIVTSIASHGIFITLTWIFWTAGAASITAALGGGINCSKVKEQVVYCNQLNALEGFAWAIWIIMTFAIIIVFLLGIRALRRGEGTRGQLVYSS